LNVGNDRLRVAEWQVGSKLELRENPDLRG
jgi:hypothetical protein